MNTGVNQQMKAPKPPKTGKGKKKAIIILTILLVIACGCAGGLFYCMKKGITLTQLQQKIEQVKPKTRKVNYTAYNWDSVSLRDKPSGKVIKSVNKGSILNVEEELASGWLKVKVADVEGYVYTKYTKDKKGYYRESYKTRNLTKHCKSLIRKYFTAEEKKILRKYEFRYVADWIADCGGGSGYPEKGMHCAEPKVIYLRDSDFPSPDAHDDVILHQLVHAITPEVWGDNSPFANRLRVAGFDAGLKKVQIHTGKNSLKTVNTGRTN